MSMSLFFFDEAMYIFFYPREEYTDLCREREREERKEDDDDDEFHGLL